MERWGWLYKLRFWAPPPTPAPSFSRTVSASSSRGRGGAASRSGTPPIPGSSAGGVMARQRDRSGSPMRQTKTSGRKSPNRRAVSDGVERSSRRELGDEGDMRMQALERSLAQGSSPQ